MTALLDRFFTRLPGVWTVARTIEDSRIGAGRFDGVAIFSADDPRTLAYQENGELVFGDWRGPAYRRWRYQYEGSALSIFYPGGETLLHRFEFNGDATAQHAHLCGPDQYCATFTLDEADAFTLRYAVDGPAKRYVLNTIYRRDAGTGSPPAH
ncbi:MAG: DUF6314 family protein [Terricaulis sp.]